MEALFSSSSPSLLHITISQALNQISFSSSSQSLAIGNQLSFYYSSSRSLAIGTQSSPKFSRSTRKVMDAHEATQCYCGRKAKLSTSWTDHNPSRRFFGCLNYSSNGCRYFGWFDPPLCPRAKQIIPRLLRKLDVYRGREKLSWGCIIVLWLITIIVILICLVIVYSKPKTMNGGMLSLP